MDYYATEPPLEGDVDYSGQFSDYSCQDFGEEHKNGNLDLLLAATGAADGRNLLAAVAPGQVEIGIRRVYPGH